jgi:ribosomal protein S3AE
MAIQKRKKRFFEVEIPIINKKTQIQGYEIEELANINLTYDLTRILKGKNIIIQLKTKIENHKLIADPIGIIVLPSFIRRMIRKGTDYVEDSFIIQTKNKKAIVKFFLITRRKVSRSVRKALRNKTKEELTIELSKQDLEKSLDDILKGKIQKDLSLKLKKIYPLSLCEIRVLKEIK